jgi:hypothetical protein
MGYLDVPTALGSDAPGEIAQVVAHELGHNWGRWHSPCGSPGGLDEDEPYPYAGGRIGVYGMDVERERLRSPSDPDIMGYCADPWISDHTFRRVLEFRATTGFSSSAGAGGKQASVIIWGRVQDGRLMLEPSFQVVTRPSLPRKPGPYSVEAVAADGTPLFSLSFDANEVADNRNGSRHFAFAVPLDPARAAQLNTLRLRGPGAQLSAVARSRSDVKREVRSEAVKVGREGDAVTLEWDATAHPLIVVRDPDTGEVLSLARRGRTRISTRKTEVNLERSAQLRVAPGDQPLIGRAAGLLRRTGRGLCG